MTAHLRASAHEAAGLNPAFALPDAVRASMERGLTAFVEGRIQRDFWSPRADLDVRKLAAIEALSRYGKATPRMLESTTLAPNQWPTHAVIDWLNILKRLPAVQQREQRMAEAQQILRIRLSFQGTRLIFSTEQDDHWWWLMQNGDVNTARLLLAVLDDPAWQGDLGRLASGFIARQQTGLFILEPSHGRNTLPKPCERHGSSDTENYQGGENLQQADAPLFRCILGDEGSVVHGGVVVLERIAISQLSVSTSSTRVCAAETNLMEAALHSPEARMPRLCPSANDQPGGRSSAG
mgnify:CR=1 FL=1